MDNLVVKTHYLPCLAQASYVVADTAAGTAFVVDPRRDVDAIFAEVAELGCRLKGVLLTHVHADFVSGHNELAARAKVPVILGAHAGMQMAHYGAEDGDVFHLSPSFALRAMHTPGHTPGCVTWLVVDCATDTPLKAFTGDWLFVGSVGRPDLLGALGHTKEEMAATMFNTLRTKLPLLPDECEVLPGHGPGSPCGAGFGDDLSSTVGRERATNPALQFADEAAFVEFLIGSQSEAPGYFLNVVNLNREGAEHVEDHLAEVPRMTAAQFEEARETRHLGADDIVVLDVRSQAQFCAAHIPGAISMPTGNEMITSPEDGNFGIWLGTMLDPHVKLLIVGEDDAQNEEAVRRSARVGFHNIAGVLQGGFASWAGEVTSSECLAVDDAAGLRAAVEGAQLVDVRTPGEFACPRNGRIEGAVNVELAALRDPAFALNHGVDRERPIIVYCVGGFRSTIARSMLMRDGYNVRGDLQGGLKRLHSVAESMVVR